jgi:diguanylate cyclase (GGDEF)-like protein
VTFFLNGKIENEFPNEYRVIIPSPCVSTYDKAPEMIAMQIAERVVQEVGKNTYDLIVLNFANPDMVGHTGDEQATIKANETIDKAMGMIVDAMLATGGACLITADHGNAELMRDPLSQKPHTSHTTNRVPCIYVNDADRTARVREGGRICDVAPTLLALLGLEQPAAMIEAHGQHVQDEVLIAAANSITHCTRSIDVVCRGEGVTFAVLMPKTHFAGAVAAADRMWRELARVDLRLGEGTDEVVRLRASIGVACYPTLEVRLGSELLAFAMSALRRAHSEGPAHICLYQHQAYIFQPD